MQRHLFFSIALVCCLAGCSTPATPTLDSTAPAQASASEQAPTANPSAEASSTGLLSSSEDVELVPTDDYAQGYVFNYGDEEFIAYFDTYSWRVYDSYKITNHNDIVHICQALLNEHEVYGSDWETLRTAEDMAYEWEQHNLAYRLLPEDSAWIEDAKNVDLDPDDQGKTLKELFESRTDQSLNMDALIENLRQ